MNFIFYFNFCVSFYRMAAELEKNQRLNDDMNVLQRAFHLKEKEFQGTVQDSINEQSALPDVNETNRKLDQTLRENMDLHRRYVWHDAIR